MIRGVSLAVFVLITTFAVAFATKACYLCNSFSDRDHTACVDPMSPYPAVNYTFCNDYDVCTRVSYITQKQYVVSRGCDSSINTCNNIHATLQRLYPDLSSFNCYYCTTNYCNGASGLTYSSELKETEVLEPEISAEKIA